MSAGIQLLCFAKAPELGRVKTRLAVSIGDEAALAVYQELLRRTAAVCDAWPGSVRVFRTGDQETFLASPLGHLPASEQCNGNLGERLLYGAQACLADGPLIIIGTDCPFINTDTLNELATGLAQHDICIGPAQDGGYWGIALSNIAAAEICFASDLPWSQETLLNETEKRLQLAGFTVARCAILDDLDHADDLQAAQAKDFPSISHLQALG